MTPAQLQTLKTYLTNDPDGVGFPAMSDSDATIALNAAASPAYWVWKTELAKEDALFTASVDATTFNFNGNGYITRSAGEQAAFNLLFMGGFANPSLANVRTAITDIFSGTGNAAANRTHLSAISRRTATRFEKLFATGSGTTGSPSVMALESPVNIADVSAARQL